MPIIGPEFRDQYGRTHDEIEQEHQRHVNQDSQRLYFMLRDARDDLEAADEIAAELGEKEIKFEIDRALSHVRDALRETTG